MSNQMEQPEGEQEARLARLRVMEKALTVFVLESLSDAPELYVPIQQVRERLRVILVRMELT